MPEEPSTPYIKEYKGEGVYFILLNSNLKLHVPIKFCNIFLKVVHFILYYEEISVCRIPQNAMPCSDIR